MRQLCKYLVAFSLLLSASLNYTMDNFPLDTSNVTKAGCGSGCGCGPCGSSCGPCGSGCGSSCGPCGSSCGDCCGGGDCCDSCCQASACGYPFFAYRSTSINAARDIVGIQPWINRYDMDSYYSAFSVALEYTRSFKPYRIAQFLFGPDIVGCNTLAIQGSAVQDRAGYAWLADYFGLSPAYDGRVSFCPRIENAIVNFDLYLGLDEWTEGLYFRIHSPLTWTRWGLNMCEYIVNEGRINGAEVGFAPTYMAGEPRGTVAPNYHGEIAKSDLPQSFTEAVSGCATWGDMKSPMCFGLMTCCKRTKTRLADIHAVLGWNFVLDQDYHFGLNIRTVIPTGNRPCAKYLFEPQVGDRKHWQLGVGLTSSWIFWRNEDNDDNYLGLYFDANFLHLFKTCQCRSFDFCCRPNSRYMLLAEMGTNAPDDTVGASDGATQPQLVPADYQYQKNLIPAINYTTYNIGVKIALQADLAFKLGYVKDNWSGDLGYNFWARTGEKFCMGNNCCCCGCAPDKQWAIKGDALLYGSTYVDEGPFGDPATPLSSSQSMADIHSGRNLQEATDVLRLRNHGVDNPELALKNFIGTTLYSEPYTLARYDLGEIYTSIQPTLLSCNDINFCKSPSALTHKIFANISYTWKDRYENRTPYLGVGGEAEFYDGCNQCRFAVSQWGIWLKGGIAFE